MLRNEVEQFTKLSGRDGWHTPIGVIGAYLDGYERGLKEASPKGKWIDEGFYADGHGAHAFRCSECGGHIIEYVEDPFCRWCGADMREENKMNDLISRQAAIDAVKNTEIKFTIRSDIDFANYRETVQEIVNKILEAQEKALMQLPSAEPEPCENAVSRNAIIRRLNTMDRYISEELVLCDTDKKFPKNEVFIVDDIYEEIVENLPSAQPERKWIPVTERLPEEETDVLVCNANGDIGFSSGSNSTEVKDFIWYTSGWRFGKVIAWMPLPSSYQESEQNG